MMRLLKAAAILIALPVLLSCRQEPRRTEVTGGPVTVRFSAVAADTRLSVDGNGAVSWSPADSISLWTDADGAVSYVFRLKSSNGKKAVFEGTVEGNPERREIYALYPASSENGEDQQTVRISIPEVQSADSVYAILAGTGKVSGNDFSKCTVNMNHFCCVWDVILANSEDRTVSSVVLKTSSNLFPVAADIDITAPDPSSMPVSEWTDRLELKFPEGNRQGSILARFFILPLPAMDAEKVYIIVHYEGGQTESFTRSWPGRGAAAGSRSTSSLTLGAGKKSGVSHSLDEMIVYEASPRLFARENSLDAVTAQLPRIKALGANVLWLMPVYDESEYRYGSPYSIKDMYAVGEEYGTMESLQRLVRTFHDNDIAVILDIITNHTGPDCSWVQEHPGWYLQGFPEGSVESCRLNWTGPDSLELRSEFLKLMKYWIDNADVDGYRCDTAAPTRDDGITDADWKWIISNLRASYPERTLLMLAEAAPPRLLADGFDLNYGWHFCDALEKVFSDETANTSRLFTNNTEEMEGAAAAGPDKARMRFSTNHDRAAGGSPAETYGTQEAAMAATALAFTMGGVPMVFSSQEIGYPGHLSIFKGVPPVLDWTSGQQTREEITRMLSITRRKSMRRGTTTKMNWNKLMISFLRQYEDETILVIANVRGKTVLNRLKNVSDEYFHASYTNLMTGEPFRFESDSLTAYQYYILEPNE